MKIPNNTTNNTKHIVQTVLPSNIAVSPNAKTISLIALAIFTCLTISYFLFKWIRPAKPLEPKHPLFFVTFDKGDFNSLSKISAEFPGSKIIAMGTSKKAAEDLGLKNVTTLETLGVGVKVDETWHRDLTLSPKDITLVVDSMVKTYPTAAKQILFIGVASVIQKQIAEEAAIAFKKKNKKFKVIAIWDNFNADLTSPYGKTAFEVQKVASKVLVPTKQVAKILDPEINRIILDPENTRAVVTGSPAFDELKAKVNKLNEAIKADPRVKADLLKKYGLESGRSTIVYFGGADAAYHQNTAEKQSALNLFFDCIQPTLKTDVQVLVLPHPKIKAEKIEEKLFKDVKNVHVIDSMTNEEALVLANTVLTYNSSLGDFARYLDKKVIFIVPANEEFRNNLVSSKNSLKVSNPKEFSNGLIEISLPAYAGFPNLLSVSISDQITDGSTKGIVDLINTELLDGAIDKLAADVSKTAKKV
ncbi:MAG: hypothetical protein H0W88_05860 [Parachlamydiaceae bacterium]|nr:hypothetical protein [Parachlamydiaceae bacterium]